MKKNIFYIISTLIGGISGYFYWLFYGDYESSDIITSSPRNVIIWGAIMFSLILSMFNFPKKATRSKERY